MLARRIGLGPRHLLGVVLSRVYRGRFLGSPWPTLRHVVSFGFMPMGWEAVRVGGLSLLSGGDGLGWAFGGHLWRRGVAALEGAAFRSSASSHFL